MKKILLSIFCFNIFVAIGYGFQIEENNTQFNKGMLKPSMVSTHPFGLFFNRLQGNFKTKAATKFQLSINLDSGNVWGTPITVYVPNDPQIRDQVRAHEWHQAQYFFDEESLDAAVYSLQIDGVIKSLRIQGKLPLSDRSELVLASRLFMLTEGKAPFSILTSDDFIEKFHEKIAGGDDPFDRGVFGLNNAQITYTDRNDRTLDLRKNDIVFSGIETSYYYYPTNWSKSNFKVNMGTHLGINISRYNSSVDLGASINSLYIFNLSDNANINLGLGISALRKEFVALKNNNLDLGSNKLIGNLETALEYTFISRKNAIHAFGVDYYLQTRLFRQKELGYSIPIRHPDAHKSWGHGVTNLYKTNNYWSLYYSFGKKLIKTLYLQQDLQVNNNPDIQTGVGISFNLK